MAEHLSLPDEAATRRLGAALAAPGPDRLGGLSLHLSGELGAGKTTLVRGLLRAFGYEGRVKSPTYTLLESYGVSRLNLYHFDFYRIKDRAEWLSSGFREHFNAQSLCIVEWPERAGTALGAADLEIRLLEAAPGRAAEITARSAAGEDWLASALRRWRSG
ncbi:MAG TPA: tRNA (adenosine(37)-N6)-threonylcarbamoyltransferase complex ATPase subunit type 1 TsaE [Burkholderiales bacterium]|nr:tRNA (adenosine(37)-N6)-threonylcarbamoyltransferase complex ATPase subunit type 1 TsaE [Burkholderiales bacterium]